MSTITPTPSSYLLRKEKNDDSMNEVA